MICRWHRGRPHHHLSVAADWLENGVGFLLASDKADGPTSNSQWQLRCVKNGINHWHRERLSSFFRFQDQLNIISVESSLTVDAGDVSAH